MVQMVERWGGGRLVTDWFFADSRSPPPRGSVKKCMCGGSGPHERGTHGGHRTLLGTKGLIDNIQKFDWQANRDPLQKAPHVMKAMTGG